MSNAASNGSVTRSPSTQIIEKAKRRRFSMEEKVRILRQADACAPGTVGAFLRREGIYSSQLYAWRRERERGDLDSGIVRKRSAAREAQRADAQRIVELEREIRKLKRRNDRLELFERNPKKSRGALGSGLQEPRDRRERLNQAALTINMELPLRPICAALGTSRSTLLRRKNFAVQATIARSYNPKNALTEAERAIVLATLNSERFADLAPTQIFAQLLDEGVYLCSISTMYRILRANAQVLERRRIARHPEYQKPELLATAPRQVFSWDITKLRGPEKGVWYSLLVMIDIFSRYVVGWMLVRRSNAEIAKQFIGDVVAREGVRLGKR